MMPEEELKLIEIIKGKLKTFFASNYFENINTAEELRNLFSNFSNFTKVKTYLRNEFDKEIDDRTTRIESNQADIDERTLQKNHLDEIFPDEG